MYKKLTSIAEYLDMSEKLMVYTEPDYSNRKTDRIVTEQGLAWDLWKGHLELQPPAGASYQCTTDLTMGACDHPPVSEWGDDAGQQSTTCLIEQEAKLF